VSRRLVAYGLLALVLTAVETALLAAFGVSGIVLHLSLGLLFFAAVRAGDIEGAGIAAVVGYGWDLFAGTPSGLSIAPAIAIFVGVRVLSQRAEVAGYLGLAVLAFLSILFHGIASLGLLAFAGGTGGLSVWPALGTVLRQSLLAAPVVPLVFGLARRLDRFFADERAESGVWLS
jgi:hypothetical protein